MADKLNQRFPRFGLRRFVWPVFESRRKADQSKRRTRPILLNLFAMLVEAKMVSRYVNSQVWRLIDTLVVIQQPFNFRCKNQLDSNLSRISPVFLTKPMRGNILATVSVCSSADMAAMASSAKI
jgi:hypothetical protein